LMSVGLLVLVCNRGYQYHRLLFEISENKKFAVDLLLLWCNKRDLQRGVL
jgi:hypothetical protein